MANRTIRTPEKEQAILDALELHPSKTRACRSARVSRQRFYEWCKDDAEFADRVEAAREKGIDALEDALFRDAIDGHNTTAAIFMLKSWRRERYGDKSEITHMGNSQQPITIRSIVVPLPVTDSGPTEEEPS